MNRILGAALFAAVAAAPAALEAQRPDARSAERGLHMAAPPAARALALRAELGLTADQVNRLEAIQQRAQAQNAPLLERLRASGFEAQRQPMTPEQREAHRQKMQERQRATTPEQRQQMRERMQSMTPEQRGAHREQMRAERGQAGMRGERGVPQELRPVMQELRENHRAAAQEARAVLTPQQHDRLRELAAERRGEGRARRGAVQRSR
jgi:Spy/CpxP family protein refolding chaperone